MNKWLEWYQTPEGKAYYDKYLKDIPGINEDENTIKNAYYSWVDSTYNITDNIKERFSDFQSVFKIACVLGIIYIAIKIKKDLTNGKT